MIDPVAVVDIDGVLADFSLAFTRRLADRGLIPSAIPCSAQQTWNFRDSLPVTRNDERAVWAEIDASHTFWAELPVVATEEDRIALHRRARRAGLVYMTGRLDRGNRTFAQTKHWLIGHGFPLGELVMQGDKARGVATLGGTVIGIVDDKPDALETLVAAGEPVTALTRPYNEHVLVPRVAAVAEWAEGCGRTE